MLILDKLLCSGSVRCKGIGALGNLQKFEKSLNSVVEEHGINLVPSDLALSLKRITAGLGRQNPVERVLFVDSSGRCTNYNSKYLKELMNIEEETMLIFLRREGGSELVREAAKVVQFWLRNEFQEEAFEVRDGTCC